MKDVAQDILGEEDLEDINVEVQSVSVRPDELGGQYSERGDDLTPGLPDDVQSINKSSKAETKRDDSLLAVPPKEGRNSRTKSPSNRTSPPQVASDVSKEQKKKAADDAIKASVEKPPVKEEVPNYKMEEND